MGAQAIFARLSPTESVADKVSDILRRVREEGDAALLEYTERFDGVRPDSLAVTP
jgi:histidinol dehydrogenase